LTNFLPEERREVLVFAQTRCVEIAVLTFY
jgi:hypothetical protein